MKKHITQNGKLGLSKKRRKGENSTINEMNVRGKIVSVLVQVNRKSIVKTLSMGLICELDLAQAKGKRGERENETETRHCEDCTVKRWQGNKTGGSDDETINETVHYVKNKGMKKDSEIPEQVGSERKRENLRVQEEEFKNWQRSTQRDAETQSHDKMNWNEKWLGLSDSPTRMQRALSGNMEKEKKRKN